MRNRKTAIASAVLSAFVFGVLGTASSSASSATGYTCVKNAGPLVGAHCSGSSGGEYGHVAITENQVTTGTATNANTAESTNAFSSLTLKGALAGVEFEITCSEGHGEGTFSNKTESGEMLGHMEGRLHFTKCVVKKPVNKDCVVKEETITTEPLTARTSSPTSAETKPKAGTKLADITIEKCTIPSLNGTFPVTGSVKSPISGATFSATEFQTTTDNTIKFGGVKAGVEGALTIKTHSEAGEETKPLTAT
ncbi:MAG TPA: hypothetical protein VFJ57_09160 [Solirubrobacterales bacterium]|nr:hypothetical protein [Solirubrobacterales bacterium]